MKFFEVIDDDHAELDDLEKTLTLKCSAVQKFLPYDGFYPAERTLELGSLFSASYFPYITASGDYANLSSPVKVRPIMSAFMAPGILYNTVKSGIAVDYPVYTSSYDVVNYLREDMSGMTGYYTSSYFALGTGSRGTAGWDYRVPFEALLLSLIHISEPTRPY